MASPTDNLFGKIAITRGLVTPKELLECLAAKDSLRRQGKNVMLGQIMFERGYLTKEQLVDILDTQKKAILVCSSCGTKYNVEGFQPGRKVKCRVCRTVLRVPQSVDTVRVDRVIDQTPKDPLIGKTIGTYQVTQKLGAGGMSSVYEVIHSGLEKKMALKLMSKAKSTDEAKDRFMREARVVAKLEHPNIVGVYDVGENEEFFYLAMEYLEGDTLEDVLSKKEKLPPAEAARIVQSVARALHAAHQQGIIHRDIKPDNIMIVDGVVKVTDFGLAKMKGGRADITRAGVILGTPFFMSPEQCERKALDIRSDLYSLGVTFYNALTGKKPFEGGKPAEIMFSHINEEPIPPNLLEPSLPYEVTAVVLKLMKKDRRERYQTPAELVAAIDEIKDKL